MAIEDWVDFSDNDEHNQKIVCSRCGVGDLYWSMTVNGWRLFTEADEQHFCEPSADDFECDLTGGGAGQLVNGEMNMETTNESGTKPAGAESCLTTGLCADSFEISRFRDGGLVLSCGVGGMETDLVFASGAVSDSDPTFEKQLMILDFILKAVHNRLN